MSQSFPSPFSRVSPRGHAVAFLCASLVLSGRAAPAGVEFVRGDVNADGQVTIADANSYKCLLFCEVPWPCADALDANDDGAVDLVDVVTVLTKLFVSDPGRTIAPPYPDPGVDPTDDRFDCASYDVEAAPLSAALVTAGHVTGAPGEDVAIPIFLTEDTDHVEAIELALSYDPEVFAPRSYNPDNADEAFAGTVFRDGQSLAAFVQLRAFPEQGLLRVGFVFDLVSPFSLAPGETVHVLNVLGTVLPDAQVGSKMAIEFVERDTADGLAHTELAHNGTFAAEIVRQTVPGSLTVSTAFVRGDANLDGGRDISDPIDILLFLFSGGGQLRCMDASDANDDGGVNISDSVYVLEYLFSGGPPPPPPHHRCGVDATDDLIGCRDSPCS